MPTLLPSSRLDVEGLQLFEVITKAFLLHKGLDIWVGLPKSQEKMKINSFTILNPSKAWGLVTWLPTTSFTPEIIINWGSQRPQIWKVWLNKDV